MFLHIFTVNNILAQFLNTEKEENRPESHILHTLPDLNAGAHVWRNSLQEHEAHDKYRAGQLNGGTTPDACHKRLVHPHVPQTLHIVTHFINYNSYIQQLFNLSSLSSSGPGYWWPKNSVQIINIMTYCIVLMGWSLLPNALRPF